MRRNTGSPSFTTAQQNLKSCLKVAQRNHWESPPPTRFTQVKKLWFGIGNGNFTSASARISTHTDDDNTHSKDYRLRRRHPAQAHTGHQGTLQ